MLNFLPYILKSKITYLALILIAFFVLGLLYIGEREKVAEMAYMLEIEQAKIDSLQLTPKVKEILKTDTLKIVHREGERIIYHKGDTLFMTQTDTIIKEIQETGFFTYDSTIVNKLDFAGLVKYPSGEGQFMFKFYPERYKKRKRFDFGLNLGADETKNIILSGDITYNRLGVGVGIYDRRFFGYLRLAF